MVDDGVSSLGSVRRLFARIQTRTRRMGLPPHPANTLEVHTQELSARVAHGGVDVPRETSRWACENGGSNQPPRIAESTFVHGTFFALLVFGVPRHQQGAPPPPSRAP